MKLKEDEKQKLEWEFSTVGDQQKCYQKALYLLNKGYVIDMTIDELAKHIYESSNVS